MLKLMPKGAITCSKASFIGGFFLVGYSAFFALNFAMLTSCASPAEAGKECVFRYNEPAGIPTLDPAFAKEKSTIWATQLLYDGLVRLDTAGTVQPALAESWSQQADGTTFTFNLREAYFHNGARVLAQDVVTSLYRLSKVQLASPGSWVMDRVDTLFALGTDAVRIELSEPFAPFLSLLAMPYASVVYAREDAPNLATSPVGTGPFMFHTWHYGERLVLHAHPNYWRKDTQGRSLPYIDGVAVSFIPDAQSAFLEYMLGHFELLPSLDPSFKDELLDRQGQLQQKYQEKHRLLRSPFLNTEYLVINAESGLDRKLRWALNAGFDRALMIATLRNGVGAPAHGGFIPLGLPEHQPHIGATYSPDSVREVLATYPQLPEVTLTTVANYRDLCEFVQGSLASLGWQINVEVVPSATLRTEKSKGTLDLFRASWMADYPDAENYAMLFYSDYSAPAGPNYSRYQHAAFDELYQQILALPYGEERSLALRSADSLLMHEAALVPLYYDEVLRVVPKHVTGLQTNALNALMVEEVKRW